MIVASFWSSIGSTAPGCMADPWIQRADAAPQLMRRLLEGLCLVNVVDRVVKLQTFDAVRIQNHSHPAWRKEEQLLARYAVSSAAGAVTAVCQGQGATGQHVSDALLQDACSVARVRVGALDHQHNSDVIHAGQLDLVDTKAAIGRRPQPAASNHALALLTS